MAVTVAAPAKLNLYLHVTGKRPDGYHLLDSLIAFADVADRVTARPAAGASLTLQVKGPFAKHLADEADNLVLRAARALRQAAGTQAGAHLVLEKYLPVASGIGGGSADAAAALKALWGVEMAADAMMALCLELGADVPVCFDGRPAFVGGIGEGIDPAPPLPKAALVLVNPGVPVSTPAVFKARAGGFQAPDRFAETPIDAGHLAFLLKSRTNGLSEAAIAAEPAIGDVLAALEATEAPLLCRMSGSGGTCFALYETQGQALLAAEALMDGHADWWVAAGRLGAPQETLA